VQRPREIDQGDRYRPQITGQGSRRGLEQHHRDRDRYTAAIAYAQQQGGDTSLAQTSEARERRDLTQPERARLEIMDSRIQSMWKDIQKMDSILNHQEEGIKVISKWISDRKDHYKAMMPALKYILKHGQYLSTEQFNLYVENATEFKNAIEKWRLLCDEVKTNNNRAGRASRNNYIDHREWNREGTTMRFKSQLASLELERSSLYTERLDGYKLFMDHFSEHNEQFDELSKLLPDAELQELQHIQAETS